MDGAPSGQIVPTDPAVQAGDLLRLENCPQCGYALAGLPAAGICPECGTAYDQSTVVLHGWGRGEHATLDTARPLSAVLIGLCYVGLLAYVWHSIRQPDRENWVLVG